MTNKSPLLELKNLSKSFYDEKQGNREILKDFNLQLQDNEFLCILGQSGCGKTTLLRCVAGFEKFSGNVFVNGEETKEPDTRRLMVFQGFEQLFPWKTIEKNIQYPLKTNGLKNKKTLLEISTKYLKKVGLLEFKDHYPHQLSGGMKQRVAIARALAMKPNLLLMDEPFASLDALTRRHLQFELMKINEEEKTTVMFVTHNIQEALVLSTRYIVMSKKGEIILDEENDLEKPITPASKGFGVAWDKINDALENK